MNCTCLSLVVYTNGFRNCLQICSQLVGFYHVPCGIIEHQPYSLFDAAWFGAACAFSPCTLLFSFCQVITNPSTGMLNPCINSSPPSAAYMRQWTGSALVQIMACRLFDAKPLSEPMLDFVNWTLRNKLQYNFNQNTKRFIHENASENIGHFVQGEMS